MIYSIVPQEVIFSQAIESAPKTQYIHYHGEMLEVNCLENSKFEISRIIGTNPRAYLDKALQPGTIF